VAASQLGLTGGAQLIFVFFFPNPRKSSIQLLLEAQKICSNYSIRRWSFLFIFNSIGWFGVSIFFYVFGLSLQTLSDRSHMYLCFFYIWEALNILIGGYQESPYKIVNSLLAGTRYIFFIIWSWTVEPLEILMHYYKSFWKNCIFGSFHLKFSEFSLNFS
jgi:hypothetical protein